VLRLEHAVVDAEIAGDEAERATGQQCLGVAG
jgi:hypothetical protein